MAQEMVRTTQTYKEQVDVDCVQTAQGRASLFFTMAIFARAGCQMCATACTIDIVSYPETKTLVLECTFKGCGSWDFYARATAEEKRILLLDMVMTAFEVHVNDPRVAPLWGKKPSLVKDDVAGKLAELSLNDK